MRLKLVPLLPTNVVQAKAEEYFPESTCATTNTWPYYRYRETAGKLNLVHHNTNLHYAPAIHITTSINVYFAALDVYITHGILLSLIHI